MIKFFRKSAHYFFIVILASFIGACKKKASPPNIIIMLADDAGYADFGFMGSEDLLTPNLDKLAHEGMIFKDAHVSATVCAPSRAGLLTGRYQQRFGFECNALGSFSGIDTAEITIAEMLKKANYQTAVIGKWHVGDVPEARPNKAGFDYSWSFLSGARSYFPNQKEDQEGNVKSIRENDAFTTFDGYLTDVLGEKAVDFIERNKEKPFFIYWSPNAVHTPMEAKENDLEKFKGHSRQKLAAMTWALDRAVGNIYQKLEKEGLSENTLIFFLSDNGGAGNNQSSNIPLKGYKGNKYEGGQRVSFFAHWPAAIKAGSNYEGLTSSLDIFATAAEASGVTVENEIDGVSLLPVFKGEENSTPHKELYWRKEGMAASRDNNYKMIRVDSLGYRLYNLKNDLGETKDLSASHPEILRLMQEKLTNWEKQLRDPLWLESEEWNEVTWWIHKDLFENKEVRAKSPQELNRITSKE